jgi:hypothetical protein
MNSNKEIKMTNSLEITNDKISMLLNKLEDCLVENISDELIIYIRSNSFFRFEGKIYRDYIDRYLVEL